MKLLIERAAHEKIRAYTELCADEISGLGKVRVENGDFIVSDVAIFTQTVSSAHSTIDPKALPEFQTERVKAGESKARINVYQPVHLYADLDVEIISNYSDEIKVLCESEIKAKVSSSWMSG